MSKDTRPVMVSIRCTTYNHEKYIRDALEGFVKQKTNFRFEAIVHDDASTDGTADIIREYAEKYPEIIKPIYETENQYSKHDGSLQRITYAACTGKYIAFCEGDDYWIDPLKLQKQVDILEANPNVTMVHTGFKNVDETGNELYRKTYEGYMKKSFSGDVLLQLFKGNYIMTLTKCVRREVLESEIMKNCPVSLDYLTAMTAACMGDVYYLPERTACYRMSSNGMIMSNISYVVDTIDKIRMYFGELYFSGGISKLKFNRNKKLSDFLVLSAYSIYKHKNDATYLKKFITLHRSLALVVIKHMIREKLLKYKKR